MNVVARCALGRRTLALLGGNEPRPRVCEPYSRREGAGAAQEDSRREASSELETDTWETRVLTLVCVRLRSTPERLGSTTLLPPCMPTS
jgi:hypothetical protein